MERNFWGELFLRIGADFLCFAELIFAIRTDWFFLLGINFCDFRNYPVRSIDNREFKVLRLRTTATDKYATAHDQNHVTVHFSRVVLRLR